MTKYGVDIGHNCSPDIGASGIKQEDVLTKEVGTKVIEKLKRLGHQVVNCTPSRASSATHSLAQRCNIANSNNVDVFISIHFNCANGKAKGAEVFGISNKSKAIAKPVLDNIVSLGYLNRGVKDGSNLYVLSNTDMPAILIECCFCDSKDDMQRYNAEAMAEAIVKGLTGKASTSPSDSDSESPSKPEIPSILELQKALNRLKIRDQNGKPLAENGTTDAATKSAIKRFESIVGINANEIAGSDTWNAINQILAKPTLRPNHAGGPVVRYLQFRMGSETDGVYGPVTADTVKKFQTQQGLTADGIVGSITWDKLIS
jgi:N-acetylmuramoyl-L-alanine amidase